MTKIRRIVLVTVLAATGLAGCSAARWLWYVAAPREKLTVEAKYAGLPGHRVAIVIWSDMATRMEYPAMPLTLGTAVRGALMSDLDDVTVVDARAVVRFQDDNIRWEEMSEREIAERLNVDHVIRLDIEEYSTHDVSQISAFQTRIVGTVRVYDMTFDEELDPTGLVWESEDPIVTIHPQDPVYEPTSEGQLRRTAESQFAEEFAKLFYTHSVEIAPEDQY